MNQSIPNITLNNGILMPQFGLGVWESKEGSEVINAVLCALEAGYRSIDTASIYMNERGVGKAIKESRIPRQEIFLTSKVWNSDQGFDSTMEAFDKSLERLDTDYLDLYLIHWPVAGKFKDTWRALEKLYLEDRVRSIGVSNFMIHHLDVLLDNVSVVPVVNQIELHPYIVQEELQDYCKEIGIAVEAWSPIMKGRFKEIDLFQTLGAKYGKTGAQVILRWDIQKGLITIPKSVRESRIRENMDIFDFTLTEAEMEQINALDRNHRFGPDPDNFNF